MIKKILSSLALLAGVWAVAQEETSSKEIDSLHPQDIELIKSIKKRRISTALTRTWELDDNAKRGTFRLVNHRLNYVLPVRLTDNFNRQPHNSALNRAQPEYKDYQNIEAKFQVSLKAKIVQDAFWGKGDFWVGYTQVAYWQVYNGNLSRPFREMNYEPEVFFIMPLNMSIGNFKWKLMGISLNHQSNGKEELLSRSWNRLIVSTAYEWGDFMFLTNTIFRLPEKEEEDDNPDIQKYIGRWKLTAAYNAGGGHTFTLSTQNNLSFKHNRSFTELTYIFPISGNLKGILQASHGYGDSLIEYNHKQTSVGLGVVFLEL